MGGDGGETLWGKLAYLAPEQLDRGPLTPRVDLWGAALVLYEVLGNQRTFQGNDTEQLQQAVRNGQIKPLEELREDFPSGLAHVLRRALNRDPDKRYQTAAEFSDALKPFHDEMVGEALGIASVVRGLFKQ